MGGGGVVAKKFRDPYSVGYQNFFRYLQEQTLNSCFFPVNCNIRPKIRVIQTCIVFCPNNVDSLPEFMSTNCPNWGGGNCPPCPPVPYAYDSNHYPPGYFFLEFRTLFQNVRCFLFDGHADDTWQCANKKC